MKPQTSAALDPSKKMMTDVPLTAWEPIELTLIFVEFLTKRGFIMDHNLTALDFV